MAYTGSKGYHGPARPVGCERVKQTYDRVQASGSARVHNGDVISYNYTGTNYSGTDPSLLSNKTEEENHQERLKLVMDSLSFTPDECRPALLGKTLVAVKSGRSDET